MSDRNNDIFHISLTEIAYTIIMILVLLLGARIYEYAQQQEQHEVVIAKQENLIREKRAEIEQLNKQLNELRTRVAALQEITNANPCGLDKDDPVTTMMPCVKCIARRGNLTQEEAQAATDMSIALIEEWRKLKNRPTLQALKKSMAEARKLMAEGKRVVSREDFKALEAAKSAQERDLKEAQAKAEYFRRRSGIDLPPCWMDDAGRSPQYLFTVQIDAQSQVHVTPAWPAERDNDAATIPGVAEILAKKTMNLNEFARLASPILKHANARKPEACRHYVRLQNEVPDRRGADRARLKIENFFYKYEVHN